VSIHSLVWYVHDTPFNNSIVAGGSLCPTYPGTFVLDTRLPCKYFVTAYPFFFTMGELTTIPVPTDTAVDAPTGCRHTCTANFLSGDLGKMPGW
jgi:hypothetical protein